MFDKKNPFHKGQVPFYNGDVPFMKGTCLDTLAHRVAYAMPGAADKNQSSTKKTVITFKNVLHARRCSVRDGSRSS